jgi:hypothetical protein
MDVFGHTAGLGEADDGPAISSVHLDRPEAIFGSTMHS